MYPQCFPEGADMIDALDFYFQVNGNQMKQLSSHKHKL